jgi:hypothetical protein
MVWTVYLVSLEQIFIVKARECSIDKRTSCSIVSWLTKGSRNNDEGPLPILGTFTCDEDDCVKARNEHQKSLRIPVITIIKSLLAIVQLMEW